ncbi:unnamed protein product, partial [Prorocentrum cordatum]
RAASVSHDLELGSPLGQPRRAPPPRAPVIESVRAAVPARAPPAPPARRPAAPAAGREPSLGSYYSYDESPPPVLGGRGPPVEPPRKALPPPPRRPESPPHARAPADRYEDRRAGRGRR